MRFRSLLRPAVVVALAVHNTVQACRHNCTNESQEPIELVPAPWTLKGDIYGLFLLPGAGIPLLGNALPTKAFSPLERQFAASVAGEFVGKIGMIQVIRYYDSPVGPYDELLIVPGFFGYENNGTYEEGLRVSRIYVSQKYTAWNGRVNWNIPKHLARFDWTDSANGTTTVKIYPFDTSHPPPSPESGPSEKPFFQMSFSPLLPQDLLSPTTLASHPFPAALNPTKGLNLNPALPFTTDLYALLGIDATLVQPPLPAGNDTVGVLGTGGPRWKSVEPGQVTERAVLGTIDMDQTGGDGEERGLNAVGDEFERNFWPGLGRHNVGVRMEDATITFSEAVELEDVVAL